MRFSFGRRMALVLMCVLSGSLAAVADSFFPEGTYTTDGWSHYKDKSVHLSEWGDGYMMSATLLRNGHEYETEAFLRPAGQNHFSGNGTITVRYTPQTGCRHKFGVQIFVNDKGLFFRENTPQYIPFDPHGPCTGAGPYQWFNHPKIYSAPAQN